MKTVLSWIDGTRADAIVSRVSDKKAAELVATGEWQYCPKWVAKGGHNALRKYADMTAMLAIRLTK